MKTNVLRILLLAAILLNLLTLTNALTEGPPKEEVSLTIEQWMVLHESGYISGALAQQKNWRKPRELFYQQKVVDSLEIVETFNALNEIEGLW